MTTPLSITMEQTPSVFQSSQPYFEPTAPDSIVNRSAQQWYRILGGLSVVTVAPASINEAVEWFLSKGTSGVRELLELVREEKNGEQLLSAAEVLARFKQRTVVDAIGALVDPSIAQFLVALRGIENGDYCFVTSESAKPARFVVGAFHQGILADDIELQDAAVLAATSFEKEFAARLLSQFRTMEPPDVIKETIDEALAEAES